MTTPLAAALELAKSAWGLRVEPTLLASSQNAVYRSATRDGPVVVRLTPAAHRSVELIQAELEWMQYLGTHGVPVSTALAAEDGALVRSLPGRDGAGAGVHLTVFATAPGQPLPDPRQIDDALAFRWGALLGQMNRIELGFTPTQATRPSFRDAGIYSLAAHCERLSAPHPVLRETAAWVSELSPTRVTFGLIHGDLQQHNLHDDGARLHPFDFDDCCYHWRLYDVAVPLYCLSFDLSFQGAALEGTSFASVSRSLIQGFISEYPHLPEAAVTAGVRRFVIYRICLLLTWTDAEHDIPHWKATEQPERRARLRQWALEHLPRLDAAWPL